MCVIDFLSMLDDWNFKNIVINNNYLEPLVSMPITDYMFESTQPYGTYKIVAWDVYDNDICVRVKTAEI